LTHSTTFVKESNSLYKKVKGGQDVLEHAFIDEVRTFAHTVDPLLTTCQLNKVHE
jgi:hypothetical protein